MELTIMEERNTRNKQTKRIPYFTNCRVDFMLFLIVNICRLLQNVTASTEKTQRLASYLITLRQDVKELVKLLLQCISKVRGMVRVKSSLVRQMIRKDKDSPWLLFLLWNMTSLGNLDKGRLLLCRADPSTVGGTEFPKLLTGLRQTGSFIRRAVQALWVP